MKIPASPKQPYDREAAGKVLRVARSYLDRTDRLVYSFGSRTFLSGYDVCGADGRGFIDCSTFIVLVLAGIPYEESPYASGTAEGLRARPGFGADAGHEGYSVLFDFSDLPALIGSFSLGPVCGIMIELVKNLFHSLVSQSFGIGELSNFLLGAVFVGVAGIIYRFKHNKKGAIIGSLIGAISMAIVSLPFNYFIVYPVYYNFMPKETIVSAYQAIVPAADSIEKCLLIFNVPFTFMKGLIDCLITFLIYKKLSPILKGTSRRRQK